MFARMPRRDAPQVRSHLMRRSDSPAVRKGSWAAHRRFPPRCWSMSPYRGAHRTRRLPLLRLAAASPKGPLIAIGAAARNRECASSSRATEGSDASRVRTAGGRNGAESRITFVDGEPRRDVRRLRASKGSVHSAIADVASWRSPRRSSSEFRCRTRRPGSRR